MANALGLFVILLIIAVVYIQYNNIDVLKQVCRVCESETDCPVCQSCAVTQPEAMAVLMQLSKGCTKRLRGVVRESAVSKNDVMHFLNGGDKRVVVVTDVIPETFKEIVDSGKSDLLSKIKAAVLGSATVAGLKTYMVMSVKNGKMSPAGAPTTVFNDAFKYLNDRVRKDVGSDHNDNLVVYIDEDIPCDAAPVADIADMMDVPIEECCGRRREGLQVLNDQDVDFGDSMYNYYHDRL